MTVRWRFAGVSTLPGLSFLKGRMAGWRPSSVRLAAGGGTTSRLLAWYESREKRERILIVVGGAVLAAYVGYAGMVQPLSSMRKTALADIAKYEAVSARITAAGDDLSLVAATGATLPDASIITQSATAVGLVIRRIEPEGERTRIEVEDAEFAVLIDWLARLETEHSLHIATIEIDRRPPPGIVSARLSVER